MSEHKNLEGTPNAKGGADPGQATEPRLPWEVSALAARRPSGTPKAAPDHSPERFAGAGKLDILAKIAQLRQEMDRLYHQRDVLKPRVSELESACAEATAQLAVAQEESRALAREKMDWAGERRGLLDQIADLRERLEKSEAAGAEALSQLETARVTIEEITDALNWRDAVATGQEPGQDPQE